MRESTNETLGSLGCGIVAFFKAVATVSAKDPDVNAIGWFDRATDEVVAHFSVDTYFIEARCRVGAETWTFTRPAPEKGKVERDEKGKPFNIPAESLLIAACATFLVELDDLGVYNDVEGAQLKFYEVVGRHYGASPVEGPYQKDKTPWPELGSFEELLVYWQVFFPGRQLPEVCTTCSEKSHFGEAWYRAETPDSILHAPLGELWGRVLYAAQEQERRVARSSKASRE